ncbi:Uncharacterized protein APZ42_000124, partial [Daphnia magna]
HISNQVEHNLFNQSSQDTVSKKNLTSDSDDDIPRFQENLKKKSSQLSSDWCAIDESDASCEGKLNVQFRYYFDEIVSVTIALW